MKKLTAFIMLLMHMNYFMFLPQMEETDVYDANCQQTDDINSLVEYVSVVLGLDNTADDEDDDSGNNFALVKSCDYFYEQQFSSIESPDFLELSSTFYSEYKFPAPPSTSYDIVSPPPEV
jgi:hypothetical protein